MFSTDLKKINQMINLMKIRTVGAELLHVDGQTDMMKLTVAFRNFVTEPKMSTFLPEYVCDVRITT
jgi:hypothetical protein